MKRILIVGDDPSLNTGYARVARFVAQTLHDNDYRVRYLPCNATMSEVDRQQWGFELLPFNPQDRFGNRNIAQVLSEFKPSLVICFGEFSFVGYIGTVCRQLGIKSMYYMPVEGTAYPPHVVYISGGHIDYKLTLQKFNYIVAYSQFGADCINALLPGIVTDVMPHQVDTDVFRPLDRQACLKTFFPQLFERGENSAFIVGHIGRNQRRKGTDLVIQGFAEFVKRYTTDHYVKPYLFLTTDPKDTHGFNLMSLSEEYKLNGKVIFNPVVGGKQGPADNQMCEVYNTFDVHLCPHRAEGFGLPVLEGLACGIRTVTTKYATPAEFGADVCTLVEPAWLEPCPGTNTNWAVINPISIADALGKIYLEGSTKHTHTPSVAVAQQFSTKVVAKRWLGLLRDLNLPEMSEIIEQAPAPSTAQSIADAYLDTMDG